MKIRELKWSGANNPLWIIRKDAKDRRDANKQPIGNSEHLTFCNTYS
jgi:hypothetical protein